MKRRFTAFVALLSSATAQAACEAPASAEQWRTAAAGAEAAWTRLDVEAFRTATDAAAAVLPCVAEPLTTEDAARAHRLAGFRADVLGDRDAAAASFLAARRLDPGWALPDRFPDGHPLRLLYGKLALDGLLPSPLPRPRSGMVLVDGEPGLTRVTGLPALVQWRAASGRTGWTSYLPATQQAVGYPEASPSQPAGWALLGVGAASAVAAGAAYAVAQDAHDSYFDPATPPEALDGLRTDTNTAFWVSVAAGTGALGATVAGAIVLRI